MPTVILLDVSLSMCRSASRTSNNDGPNNSKNKTNTVEIRQLANVGIGILLDYFAQNAQLEHTALVVYSSLWEVRHDFTRNHETIKNGIYDLELYDKSNVVNAIRGLLSLKLEEWAQDGTINIILVTDGQYPCQKGSRAQVSSSSKQKDEEFEDVPLDELKNQFDFPCKIQVVCIASPRDPALKYSLKFYKNLVSTVDSKTNDCPVLTSTNMKQFKQSAIWLPDLSTRDVTIESVEGLFATLADVHYKPYHTIVSCGHLSSMVLLSPKPTECLLETLKNEFDDIKNEEHHTSLSRETFVSALNKVRLFKLNEQINICGFMPLADIASPAITSRHLVLPVANSKFNEIHKAQQILSQDPNVYKSAQIGGLASNIAEDGTGKGGKNPGQNDTGKAGKHSTNNGTNDQDVDITKQPSFCVLLHNCLKQENMVAICMVGKNDENNEDWFAILHPHVDSKKKSGMILSLLLPGPQPILWLPSFRSLGSICLNSDPAPAIMDRPINGRSITKSYSSNSVIWLDPESVQADVQKVVRYARRGPDKAPQFYKELNRIRRAALSYGFFDVLAGLATILEREKRSMISDTSRPANEAMLQHIDHVISSLRTRLTEDSYDINILPIT
uniref:Integrator complex subunit 14 n=1 Tax=Aceria tosichella TaxID=561515 RepID=A0A6G1SB35_9ACAR